MLDKGYLTGIRTALAGALAAENLANPEIKTVGIIGAGAQARLQAQALKLVRKFEHLQVWSIVPEEAEDYRNEMETVLGVPVMVQTERNTLVETSDLIVTTTPSREPLIETDCVRPGTHITAMGSDQAEKMNLHRNCSKKRIVLFATESASLKPWENFTTPKMPELLRKRLLNLEA